MQHVVVVRKTAADIQNDYALYQGQAPQPPPNSAKHLKGSGIEAMLSNYVEIAKIFLKSLQRQLICH